MDLYFKWKDLSIKECEDLNEWTNPEIINNVESDEKKRKIIENIYTIKKYVVPNQTLGEYFTEKKETASFYKVDKWFVKGAYENNELVGAMVFNYFSEYRRPDYNKVNVLLCCCIVVNPLKQNEGIGYRMMVDVVKNLNKVIPNIDPEVCLTYVNRQNSRSKKIMEKVGLKVTDDHFELWTYSKKLK